MVSGGVVRRASIEDAQHILNIAEVFNSEYTDYPMNPDKAYTSLCHYIEEGIVFCTDRGAIVGAKYEDPFRDRTLLLEIGWYAEEKSPDGLILLRRFISEGKKQNVDAIVINCLQTSPKRVTTLLRRLGFKEAETSFILDIGG